MLETDRTVSAKINLYYDFYAPDDVPKPPLLVAVHGYGAHKKYMMREARLVAPEGFAIASLEAPNRFWRETKEGEFKPSFGWLTDWRADESIDLHHRFIIEAVGSLAADGLIDEDALFLFGFSQACALNFRFAFTHPGVFSGVVGMCGGIPSDLDSNDAYTPTKGRVLYLYGDNDEFYPLEKLKSFEQKLDSYLDNFKGRSYSAGHEITDEMRADVRSWLEESAA